MGVDTRNGSNPTARLMLTMLAGVATWEREIMLERQREGIAKAKAEGRYRGRPVSIDRAKVHELLTRHGTCRGRQDAGGRAQLDLPNDLLRDASAS